MFIIEIKVNKNHFKKFFELDSELDNLELSYVKSNLLTYDVIKSKVNLKEKISKFKIILDLQNILRKNDNCIIF